MVPDPWKGEKRSIFKTNKSCFILKSLKYFKSQDLSYVSACKPILATWKIHWKIIINIIIICFTLQLTVHDHLRDSREPLIRGKYHLQWFKRKTDRVSWGANVQNLKVLSNTWYRVLKATVTIDCLNSFDSLRALLFKSSVFVTIKIMELYLISL